MKFHVKFSGCSCGCTPNEDYEIESKDFKSALPAIARVYYENRSYGEDKYRKISCKNINPTREAVIINLADEIDKFQEYIKKYKSEVGEFQNKIDTYKLCAKHLGTMIPEDKSVEIGVLEEKIKDRKQLVEDLIKQGNKISRIPKSTKVKKLVDWDDDSEYYECYKKPIFYHWEDTPMRRLATKRRKQYIMLENTL